MGIRFPLASRKFEKSPVRHAVNGNEASDVSALCSRSPSQLAMKNNLSRKTGPLTVPPYWLR